MGVTVLLEMDNPRDGVVCAVCGERAADGGACGSVDRVGLVRDRS